jgi:hypothetical protein
MTVARRPFWDAADQTFPPPTVVIAPQFGTRPRPPALTLSRYSGWTRPLTYSDINPKVCSGGKVWKQSAPIVKRPWLVLTNCKHCFGLLHVILRWEIM